MILKAYLPRQIRPWWASSPPSPPVHLPLFAVLSWFCIGTDVEETRVQQLSENSSPKMRDLSLDFPTMDTKSIHNFCLKKLIWHNYKWFMILFIPVVTTSYTDRVMGGGGVQETVQHKTLGLWWTLHWWGNTGVNKRRSRGFKSSWFLLNPCFIIGWYNKNYSNYYFNQSKDIFYLGIR